MSRSSTRRACAGCSASEDRGGPDGGGRYPHGPPVFGGLDMKSPGKLIFLAALAFSLVLAPAARASIVGTTDKGELRIGALGGEQNNVKVKYRSDGVGFAGPGGAFVVLDRAGALPGPGCVPLGAKVVGCDATGLSRISVVLGDGDDVMLIKTGAKAGVPARFVTVARGGAGQDVIRAGTGDDRLLGGPGRDTFAGWKGNDRIFGGPGTDALLGFAGDDLLAGGPGADVLFGQRGRDAMLGGPGTDVILARDGRRDRRINCGAGPNARERAVTDRRDPRPVSC